MQFHITENGALRVLLSHEELARLGFVCGDGEQPPTRAALETVLTAAKAETGFAPQGRILVEAVPVEDGCLLLVTAEQMRPRLRLKRAATVGVWRFDSADALLAFADAVRPFSQAVRRRRSWCVGSLYRSGSTYDLIVYAPSFVPRGILSVLSEFAEHIGGGHVAAATEEHAVPICLHDALIKLCL